MKPDEGRCLLMSNIKGLRKIKYWLKRKNIFNLNGIISKASEYYWKLAIRYSPEILINDYPYISPNVWALIMECVAEYESPDIFEFGTGVSSLWHIRNLVSTKGSGTYTGVEHKYSWHQDIINNLIKYMNDEGISYLMEIIDEEKKAGEVFARTARFFLNSDGKEGIRVDLCYRKSIGRTGDGTKNEFINYINCLKEPIDICIVDGRARIACINKVLDNDLIRINGWLILLEAGRGTEGYLDARAMTGTYNYRPVVDRMLDCGGYIVDGEGLDQWDGLTQRRVPGISSTSSLQEACFLQYRGIE